MFRGFFIFAPLQNIQPRGVHFSQCFGELFGDLFYIRK